MDGTRLAPTIGGVSCVVVVLALLAPYALVDAAGAIGTYYGTGAVNPLFTGVVALVSLVVFAAGREGRTDPGVAAGATLAFGLFGVIAALGWAVTVPESVVVGLSTQTLLEYHRWVLAVVSMGVPAAGGWYARALGIF